MKKEHCGTGWPAPRPAASVGVRRSAPTADDDARGAAGWPRGETCHVAHGALLRARLRHHVRTLARTVGAALERAVSGRGLGRTFWRDRSRPRRIISSGETSACEAGRGAEEAAGAAGTSAGRPRGRQVNCTQQRAGWHLTSIISSVTDDLPLLRAHLSWHNLAQRYPPNKSAAARGPGGRWGV